MYKICNNYYNIVLILLNVIERSILCSLLTELRILNSSEIIIEKPMI